MNNLFWYLYMTDPSLTCIVPLTKDEVSKHPEQWRFINQIPYENESRALDALIELNLKLGRGLTARQMTRVHELLGDNKAN